MFYSLIFTFLFYFQGFPFGITVNDMPFDKSSSYAMSDLENVMLNVDTTRVKFVAIRATLARGSSAVPKKKIEISKSTVVNMAEWIKDETYRKNDHLIIHAFVHMNTGAVMDRYYIFGDIHE